MPTITVPNTFSSGAVPDSALINQNIWDTDSGTGNSSPSVLNGGLDSSNFTSITFASRVIQPQTKVYAVSALAPLDMVREVFPATSSRAGAYTPIPGVCIRFWCPASSARSIFFAYVSAGTDLESTASSSHAVRMQLYVDGSAVSGSERLMPHGYEPGLVGTTGYQYDRCFSFIQTTTLSRGWHEAYVGIYSDANNVRLRTRGISVIVYP